MGSLLQLACGGLQDQYLMCNGTHRAENELGEYACDDCDFDYVPNGTTVCAPCGKWRELTGRRVPKYDAPVITF